MYKSLLLLFWLSMPLVGNSQKITETILALRKSYNSFWTSKKAVLLVELHRNYVNTKENGSSDTTIQVFLSVNSENFELQSVSSGLSLFSAGSIFGGSGSASKTEKLVKQNGYAYLNREQFAKIFAGVNLIYSYIKSKDIITNSRLPVLAIYEDEFIKVGGEYNPDPLETKNNFFFQFEDAKFKMKETEFTEIMKFFRLIMDGWSETKT